MKRRVAFQMVTRSLPGGVWSPGRASFTAILLSSGLIMKRSKSHSARQGGGSGQCNEHNIMQVSEAALRAVGVGGSVLLLGLSS